jgi:hypothetical protein
MCHLSEISSIISALFASTKHEEEPVNAGQLRTQDD